MFKKLSWLAYRSIFLLLYLMTLLTGGLITFLLAPLTSYLLFNDWRFWRHARYFLPLTLLSYRQIYMLLTRPAYRKCCTLPLTAPPRKAPDKKRVQLAATWNTAENECGDCSRCCTQLACPLLERETGYCRSYDSFFWRYFNCGRYPSTQAQIDYYRCGKWVKKESMQQPIN